MASPISFDVASDGYQPGVCNIGPAEVARRRRAGYLGLIVAIGLAAALALIDAPSITRLLVAAPLTAGFSGFLQARMRFCANYGWRGMRNLGALGDAERVDDAASRTSDRRRSLEILAASSLGALLVATLFALLPLR